MKLILQLFLLVLCGKLAFSFDCIDITNQTKCTNLGNGCSWINAACDGHYIPPACADCVYVDSYSTGTGVGTIENPFKTLNEALLPDSATRVLTTIILNYKDETIVKQTAVATLPGTHTIK